MIPTHPIPLATPAQEHEHVAVMHGYAPSRVEVGGSDPLPQMRRWHYEWHRAYGKHAGHVWPPRTDSACPCGG